MSRPVREPGTERRMAIAKDAEVERLRRLLKKTQDSLAQERAWAQPVACCAVCLEDKADVLYHPCGHLCTCQACAIVVYEKQGTCPICRSNILGTSRVYMATNKQISRVRTPNVAHRLARKTPIDLSMTM